MVCIQPDKLALLGHVHPFGKAVTQHFHAGLSLLRKGICHGKESGVIVRTQRLLGRARATATATHQADLQGISILRVSARRPLQDKRKQHRGEGGGVAQERTAVERLQCSGIHMKED